jgi:hypothetical protein
MCWSCRLGLGSSPWLGKQQQLEQQQEGQQGLYK